MVPKPKLRILLLAAVVAAALQLDKRAHSTFRRVTTAVVVSATDVAALAAAVAAVVPAPPIPLPLFDNDIGANLNPRRATTVATPPPTPRAGAAAFTPLPCLRVTTPAPLCATDARGASTGIGNVTPIYFRKGSEGFRIEVNWNSQRCSMLR
jgi:hypothetical protein